MRRAIHAAVLGAALAGALTTSIALAQQNPKVTAEALFREGLRLMDEKKFSEACPKFAESEKLDPASGTLLNLAVCYEKNGQTASAWITYQEGVNAARSERNADNQRIAQKRMDALDAKLSKLTINATTMVDGMEIKRDGQVVSKAEWGLSIPVDPGKHVIEVTAPKKKPWSETVEVGGNAAKQAITIPTLEDAPEAPPLVPTATATTVGTSTAPPFVPEQPPSSGSSQKIVGLVVAGVGLVGVGLGTYFALHAKALNDDSLANSHCPTSKNLCDQTGVNLRDDARSSGNIASIMMGVGAVALVGGVVLFLVAPSGRPAEPRAASIQLVPTLGGALVRGSF